MNTNIYDCSTVLVEIHISDPGKTQKAKYNIIIYYNNIINNSEHLNGFKRSKWTRLDIIISDL